MIALLRAVNVGGTGVLPMPLLAAMCQDAGFGHVRTWIASGNVVFSTTLEREAACAALEARLLAHFAKAVGVIVRSGDEMTAVRDANPFPDAPGNQTMALFLKRPPRQDDIECVRHRQAERLVLGKEELYIAYGGLMSRSRLVVPAASEGTARNMNTISKLAAMARDLQTQLQGL